MLLAEVEPVSHDTTEPRTRSRYIYFDKSGVAMCDNTKLLPELIARFDTYRKLLWHGLCGGLSPLYLLVRTRCPRFLPDPKTPPVVSLELSSACNLKCSYCPVPKKVRQVRHMSEQTFARVIEDLTAMKRVRVHLRGWGEATLHPKFPEFVHKLARSATYVDIVTNG